MSLGRNVASRATMLCSADVPRTQDAGGESTEDSSRVSPAPEETVQPKDPTPSPGALSRIGTVTRKTRETDVSVSLDLEGTGKATIETGLGFFDHMLELLAGHGLFDLEVRANGDLKTGGHHTVEDVGICLGTALAEAVGDKRGIYRYGHTLVPMDESLAMVVLDLSGRPYFAYEGGPVGENIAGFDSALVSEFFRALVNHSRMTLHIRVLTGGDVHHTIEAVFKGFGKALRQAVTLDPRYAGIPSTKGVL